MEKAQFPHSFGRILEDYANTVPFHKTSPHHEIRLKYGILQSEGPFEKFHSQIICTHDILQSLMVF